MLYSCRLYWIFILNKRLPARIIFQRELLLKVTADLWCHFDKLPSAMIRFTFVDDYTIEWYQATCSVTGSLSKLFHKRNSCACKPFYVQGSVNLHVLFVQCTRTDCIYKFYSMGKVSQGWICGHQVYDVKDESHKSENSQGALISH